MELLPHPGKCPFFGGDGFLLSKCSRSHETQNVSSDLCLDEEKPWLFIGADIRWDG